MLQIKRVVCLTLCVLLVSACKSVGVGSGFEERPVTQVSEPASKVQFNDALVWLDSAQQGKRGVRFLKGEYPLSAEDDEYWYFQAPSVIEMAVLEGGNVVGGKKMPGGLMLAKDELATVPAGAYIDNETDSKILVLKMGRDFMALKGEKWQKQ
ncbi:hypothetical protein OAG1_09610 [Agarivorans sp. OAG1]|uniref:Lipoprotein n=1 Tax=Agarivorans albus MKT 106 TaxID=1331007 RepID=R9PRY7_AGAAL|nr:hypothetical protein [Agarivorans albus]BEU02161.1 hypothetical protein OAG1_09610 [Agarivorans sp. OAG1]GAD04124.1 hypothetical protein AALB_4204 [Agarivorans albus MKT 106]